MIFLALVKKCKTAKVVRMDELIKRLDCVPHEGKLVHGKLFLIVNDEYVDLYQPPIVGNEGAARHIRIHKDYFHDFKEFRVRYSDVIMNGSLIYELKGLDALKEIMPDYYHSLIGIDKIKQ